MKMRLKALHKKNLIKDKKVIVDSITDQLVPQVSSLNTPKIFDSLIKLFEDKNLNQKMALRKYLKNVKIQNAEVVIATLNGLPGSWDSCKECMPKGSNCF